MKRMPQDDKMTENTKRSRGRKNPLLLLFLLLACLAALACLAGCGDEGTAQAATITKAEWDYAQQESNFTTVFASVSESGERYSAELKAAGETFCLTTEYGSTYYKKEDGVYKRRTEQDAQWSSTEESRIGDCLGLRFPYYASFFDGSIDLSMFTAEGSLLTAQPVLLEKLSTAGADFSNTPLLYTGIQVSFLQVRLIDGRFYTASAEAVYGSETVFAEYLFHSYGTTEVELPGAKIEIIEIEPPHYEVIEPEGGYYDSILDDDAIWAEGGITAPDFSEVIWADDTDINIGIASPVDPGINEPPVIVGVIGDSGNIGDIVGDISIVGPDDGGTGDSGDIEIVDPDDGIFDLFPEENEPAIEPPGFPEENEPATEDPIVPDYGGLIVFDPTVRLP